MFKLLFFTITFYAMTVSALTPLQKKRGLLKHQNLQIKYEKKRTQAFKEYKKNYYIYKNKEREVLEEQNKVRSKLRASKEEELKRQKLERKWNKHKDDLVKKNSKIREKYLQKRKRRRKLEAKTPIKEFAEIIK